MTKQMTESSRKLNWAIVLQNIRESRRQLQEIEKRIGESVEFSPIELEIMLRHAFHHLNFAWNARRGATERYANLTDENFSRWGKYPKKFDE